MATKADILRILNENLSGKKRPTIPNALEEAEDLWESSSADSSDDELSEEDSSFEDEDLLENRSDQVLSSVFDDWFARLGFDLLDELERVKGDPDVDMDELYHKVVLWQEIGATFPKLEALLVSYGTLNKVLAARRDEIAQIGSFNYYSIRAIDALNDNHLNIIKQKYKGFTNLHPDCYFKILNELTSNQADKVDKADQKDFDKLCQTLKEKGDQFFGNRSHSAEEVVAFKNDISTVISQAEKRFQGNHWIGNGLRLLLEVVLGIPTLGLLHLAKKGITGEARFFKPETPEAIRKAEKAKDLSETAGPVSKPPE
jgi:hypothetical protein